MAECRSPLWPCAMTGAAACLAGFRGLGVIIHGSSGCFYYPASVLHAPVHGTCLTGEEVIFGAAERLREVVGGISGEYGKVAVITSCVPALTGEDVREILDDPAVIVVEAPGYLGHFETGYRAGLASLPMKVDDDACGVNIAGLSFMDPFHGGNLMEAERILGLLGLPAGVRFCDDALSRLGSIHPVTVTVNPDLPSGPATMIGSLLGLEETEKTAARIASRDECVDPDPVFREVEAADKRIRKASDTYLQRYDPPRAAVFGGAAYAALAASLLRKYLDAEILTVCSRNDTIEAPYPTSVSRDLDTIAGDIRDLSPDLIVGSSVEQKVGQGTAFAGITPPLRGRVRIRPRPIAGIQGSLSFMEEVLNACTDLHRGKPATSPV